MDFQKLNGIIPAIIQDAETDTVLMLGFMSPEALEKTRKEGKVTFFISKDLNQILLLRILLGLEQPGQRKYERNLSWQTNNAAV